MGGSVATTIRRENGEIIKMCRRTGSEAYLFLNQDFLAGNFDKTINEYLVTWQEMRDDFLAQQKGEPAKFDYSEFYGAHTLMAPEGYGLNVIDFKNKTIYTTQGYNHPGIYSIYDLNEGFTQPDEFAFWQDIIDSDLKCVAHDGRKSTSRRYTFLEYFGTNKNHQMAQLSRMLLNREPAKALAYLKNVIGKDSAPFVEMETDNFSLRIKLTEALGFTCHRFEESYDGFLSMFQKMASDGFEFDDADIEGWSAFMLDRYEEDDDGHTSESIHAALHAIINTLPTIEIKGEVRKSPSRSY